MAISSLPRTTTVRERRISPANALIVIDVQNDYCPGGSVAIEGADKVAARIFGFAREHEDDYKVIVATKDWHPDLTEMSPLYRDQFTHFNTWPVHCVANTPGAEFHPNLNGTAKNDPSWPPKVGMVDFDMVFFKGQYGAGLSGFEGTSYPPGSPDDNTNPFGWMLNDYLRDHGIGHIDIVGLGTEHCIRETAVEAREFGYDTSILTELCEGGDLNAVEAAFHEMQVAGVHIDAP